MGVEYIISEKLFKTLDEEEKKLWHSHHYEVKSGSLIAPGIPDVAEHELMEKLCELTGIDRTSCDAHHHPIAVSPCGKWSVEFAECLASCGTAPVCLVNDVFHEAVTADKAQALLDSYSNGSSH